MLDSGLLSGKKLCFYTLGCKLNFAESSAIASELRSYGAVNASKGETADICIVNTCSVTEVADRQGRQAIHKIVKNNPDALVVVTGCYAQLKPLVIENLPGVDIVIGAESKSQVVPQVLAALSNRTEPNVSDSPFFPACSAEDRTRHFLKVQDGCDYFCTYCTIPYARGRSRNGAIADIMSQVRNVARQGGREIVITGVNTGDFGRSTGEKFIDLLRQMDTVEEIKRYRISSIEPNLLTDEIINFCASSRAFMPHFHIPLQSGSDEVLKLMRRRYNTALFRQKIETVVEHIPDAFIGVDVMVGCRGERPEFFEDAYTFIDSLPISRLHVFSYSERPGTKALAIPYVVSPQEKHERSQRLIALSDRKQQEFYTRFSGTVRPVLFEHTLSRRVMSGFTDNYIRVEVPADPELFNHICDVKLGGLNQNKDALKGLL